MGMETYFELVPVEVNYLIFQYLSFEDWIKLFNRSKGKMKDVLALQVRERMDMQYRLSKRNIHVDPIVSGMSLEQWKGHMRQLMDMVYEVQKHDKELIVISVFELCRLNLEWCNSEFANVICERYKKLSKSKKWTCKELQAEFCYRFKGLENVDI